MTVQASFCLTWPETHKTSFLLSHLINYNVNLPDIWDLQRYVYQWPESDMVIHRNFGPEELWRDMKVTPVRHAVFVQVLNNEHLEETSKVTG